MYSGAFLCHHDQMGSEVIELHIENFPKQQEIFNSKARFRIAAKGRRFGLTRGAANDYILAAIEGRFRKGLWVDTVNPNIDRYVERYFIPHLKKLPKGTWDWRKQAKILQIFGSYIDFRSADRPENIEGFGYDKFFLNEAGIILKDEYLWHNAIKPMLWDYKASGVIGGTPKGKGLFYELASYGKSPDYPEYEFFTFSSFDNPFLDKQMLADDMKNMPERVIKQEIYAEFLEDTGAVFRGVQAIATAEPKQPVSGHMYVMGVDLAKVMDYTVITVYDRANNHQVYQDRFNKFDWPFQKGKIKGISQMYNNALVMIDGTGVGDPIVDDLLRSGVPVEPVKITNDIKKELIEKLSLWIEQRKMRLINLPETIEEFTDFTYDVTQRGRIIYSAPVGLHDDIVIAHALAVRGLEPILGKIRSEEPTDIQLDFQRAVQGHYYDD